MKVTIKHKRSCRTVVSVLLKRTWRQFSNVVIVAVQHGIRFRCSLHFIILIVSHVFFIKLLGFRGGWGTGLNILRYNSVLKRSFQLTNFLVWFWSPKPLARPRGGHARFSCQNAQYWKVKMISYVSHNGYYLFVHPVQSIAEKVF